MIRAIIIDDEQHCITHLQNLLKEHFSDTVDLMNSYQTLETGIKGIIAQRPDLLFLDVQIGDKTGFDVLRNFTTINFEVIFTTAYEKYAVQAFKFSAIDYLLKPIDIEDLKQGMERLKGKIAKNEMATKLDTLFHNLKDLQGGSKKICVPVLNGYVFLQVNDIIRCQSDINYTTLFLNNKQKIVVAKTLKEFEEMLREYHFFRVHNSHLVNLAYIKAYNKGKGGYITLQDNTEIEVSTRRKDEFLKGLSAF